MQTLYKGLPVFLVGIDEDSLWRNVSLVSAPAIGENFIQLSEQAEIQFSIDEDKREISGPVLIPEQLIYRKNEANGKEFYLKFSADVIKAYAIEFFKQKKETEGNVEHQVSFEGITFFESYLTDKKRGISPAEFNVPDGTWILSAKVDNDAVWELIKNGDIRGFSIDMKAPILPDRDETLDSLDELMEYINKSK